MAEQEAQQQQQQQQDAAYVHREGTRRYMEAEVLPQVQAGLAALLHKMQEERLKLAAGIGLEGGFRPESYRPFCPHEWLANCLLQHKPGGQPTPQPADAADNDAAIQQQPSSIELQ